MRYPQAMILGFSVQPSNKVFSYASSQGVSIKSECVIYRIIDLVRSKVQELLPPVLEYRVLGEALVLQLFQIHGKQKGSISVAGCRVTNGVIEKHKKVRIFRGQEEIYNGTYTEPRATFPIHAESNHQDRWIRLSRSRRI